MNYTLRSLMIVAMLGPLLAGCGGQNPKQMPAGQPAVANCEKVALKLKGYESPAQAFDAYNNAMKAKDWATAFDAMTPAQQRMSIFEILFLSGMVESDVADRHIDSEKLREAVNEETTEEQRMSLVLKPIKDKRAFFIDAAKEVSEKTSLSDSLPQGPLQKIVITGNTAHGVATKFHEVMEGEAGKPPKAIKEEYEEEYYFANIGGKWFLDAPPDVASFVRDTE